MTEYRVEIKLAGYAKEHVRRLIYAAARRFGIKGLAKDYVPSIILYGPAKASGEAEFASAVEEAASGFDLVSYRIKGFSHFDAGKRWFFNDLRGICLDVEPSENLTRLRVELAKRLEPVCEQSVPGGFSFNVPLELGDLDGERFEGVLAYLKANEERAISQRILRLAVVRNGQTVCEYDLSKKRIVGKIRRRENRALGRAIDNIKSSGEDALQPIWGKAMSLTRMRRAGRQLTLVDDNPRIRIPKVFLLGVKGAFEGRREAKARQLTRVDDNPAIRIPRVFMIGGKRPERRKKDRTAQQRLMIECETDGGGFFQPIIDFRKRFRRWGDV